MDNNTDDDCAAKQREAVKSENPLLALAGIGASKELLDLSNGRDEAILRQELHPIYGWQLNTTN
ncbi:MAG TPA: hypothetical protein ENK32_10605 [Anaerolineae bacterium]|nr:hypothetical protein [Anaerolineae bacterium]